MRIRLVIKLVTVLMVFPVVGVGQRPKMRMHKDAQSMKKEVLKQVPIGNPIQNARKSMETNGFDCAMKENAQFVEDENGDPRRPVLHEGKDFLFCSMRRLVRPLVIREWSIIITHKDNIVSDVFVNIGLTGP